MERREQLLRTRAQCNFAVVSGIAVQEHCTLEDGRALVRRWRRTGANVRCALVRMLSCDRNHTTLRTSAEPNANGCYRRDLPPNRQGKRK